MLFACSACYATRKLFEELKDSFIKKEKEYDARFVYRDLTHKQEDLDNMRALANELELLGQECLDALREDFRVRIHYLSVSDSIKDVLLGIIHQSKFPTAFLDEQEKFKRFCAQKALFKGDGGRDILLEMHLSNEQMASFKRGWEEADKYTRFVPDCPSLRWEKIRFSWLYGLWDFYDLPLQQFL